jgi:hypothetical protein
LWHVHTYATLLRAVVIAGPVYWLATRLPDGGGAALVLKLAVLSAFVVGAFVAMGELDADDRRRVRAAWPRRRVVRAEAE